MRSGPLQPRTLAPVAIIRWLMGASPHLGDKKVRAVVIEPGPYGQYKVTDFKCSVADVDKPHLSVVQVVHNGGEVVFSQTGSYIEHASGRQDKLEFRNGLYVLKLWVPRDQGMDFHGQA